jgi:hypothetical protein
MKTFAEFEEIIRQCSFKPWTISVHRGDQCRIYLQIHDEAAVCNVTGKPAPWSGRKWYLSPHMTETEVVKTALKAVIAAVEHETLERFKYKDLSIFDPHIRVEDLIHIRLMRPLDARA